MSVKFEEVEKFCKFLVSLGVVALVDDEGYIVYKTDRDDNSVLIKEDNKYKRVMIMKEVSRDTDCIVVNPFNENISESADSKWLYASLAVGLSHRISEIFKYVNTIVTSSDDTGFSSDSIAFASRHKELDDKVMTHFEHISKKKLDFINIWFMRKMKEARFRCALYDGDTRIEYPTVPKKAWKIMTELMNDLLGIKNSTDLAELTRSLNSKYDSKSELITVPKLEAILTTYYKIYTQLNPYLVLCNMDDDDFVVDLTDFSVHLNNLDEYYKKTKWFTSSAGNTEVVSVSSPQQQNIPPLTPTISIQPQIETGNIPPNPMLQGGQVGHQLPLFGGYQPPQQQFGGYQQQPQFGGFQQPQQFGGFQQPQQQFVGIHHPQQQFVR